jgi:hypothetical protein
LADVAEVVAEVVAVVSLDLVEPGLGDERAERRQAGLKSRPSGRFGELIRRRAGPPPWAGSTG